MGLQKAFEEYPGNKVWFPRYTTVQVHDTLLCSGRSKALVAPERGKNICPCLNSNCCVWRGFGSLCFSSFAATLPKENGAKLLDYQELFQQERNCTRSRLSSHDIWNLSQNRCQETLQVRICSSLDGFLNLLPEFSFR